MQGRIDEVNRVLREQITGIRVVRAFVREPHERERFGRANDDLTEVAVRAGRWMATMFPLVMLVVNVASVGVIWFGGHRVDDGQMGVGCADGVPQLPHADPDVGDDGDLHAHAGAALGGLRRPDRRGPRHRVVGRAVGRARSPPTRPAAASSTWTTSPSPTPAPSRPVLAGVSLHARPGQTVAVIGSTGAGKSTLVNLVPRLFDATSGSGARRRRRRARPRARRALGPDRAGAAEGLPLHRHHRLQPAPRPRRRHRRRAVGGPRGRPGARLRRGAARRAGRAGRPGRHQLLRRPAPAPGHRPRRRTPPRHLPVRRLVLGPRPGHRRPAAGGARARSPPTRPSSWWPSASPPSATPTRSSCSRTAGSSVAAPTPSCSPRARPTRRSSRPSSPPRRRWHERHRPAPPRRSTALQGHRAHRGAASADPAAARWAAAWSARRRWTSARPPSACCAGCARTAWPALVVVAVDRRQRRADVGRPADPRPRHRPGLQRLHRPPVPGRHPRLRAARRRAGPGRRARRRASTSAPSAACC